jgi:hypothetical protein
VWGALAVELLLGQLQTKNQNPQNQPPTSKDSHSKTKTRVLNGYSARLESYDFFSITEFTLYYIFLSASFFHAYYEAQTPEHPSKSVSNRCITPGTQVAVSR